MNPLSLLPLDIWSSIGEALNTMMQPIYWAISGLLVGFHSLFSNVLDPSSGWTWTLSIVAMTVVIRTLLIPLFVKQINSSRKMQLLGPKMKVLQDKYGADRERLGQETMKLYREEGVNPAASCLPIFLQMPIFIGLFNVLNAAARLQEGQQPLGHFFVQERALAESLRDAKIFGAKISGTFMPFETFGATQWVAMFLIIAMTVTLFITQLQLMRKNMPPEALTGQMAQQQKMMLYLFPVIYMVTGVSIPIGVMTYWLASNLWTMGQQYILIHNNPAPNTPAYVDWEDRMRAKGKDPEAIIAKRLGTDRKPKTPESSDPTQVARQGGNTRTTGTPASDSTTDAEGRQRIQRQQPSRQTRSTRKQSKPRQSGETPKEHDNDR